jgi:uncharacterized protein (DUF849 family)
MTGKSRSCEGSDDLVFKNTPRDIARILTELGQERGARFEFECYDISHLYMLRHFADRGMVKAPSSSSSSSACSAASAPIRSTWPMKQIADKLFGDGLHVFGAGGGPPADGHGDGMAARWAGHVRVGLEDSLYIARGRLAQSNAEQVSDLWVDAQTRGKRLGQRLLAAVRDEGIRMWDARLMRLNVYHDNPKALAFYERIGFVAVSDAQYLTLSGAAFETLGEQA